MKTQSPRIYQTHRENQRKRILTAAEKLFIQQGIDGVTLARIAEEARLSRVTLYEYFSSKQEIAWAVFREVVREMRETMEKEVLQRGGNGLQKIERSFALYAELLEASPEHLRFIAQFNYLYAREGNAVRLREMVEEIWPGAYSLQAQLIREGMADGSIRPDLDAELAAVAIKNLINGVISRLALLEENIRGEFHHEVLEIYREIYRTYIRGLKPEST